MTQVASDVAPEFVGIDVAKDKLDLARSDSCQLLVFKNEGKEIDRAAAQDCQAQMYYD